MNQSTFQINALIFLTVFFLYACSGKSLQANPGTSNIPAYQKISAETAFEMMQKSDSFILLDVRTEQEFLDSHITGAILLPVQELENIVVSKLPEKNTLILIYCRSGIRSSNAAKILAEKGYTNVFDFGGIVDWPYETTSVN